MQLGAAVFKPTLPPRLFSDETPMPTPSEEFLALRSEVWREITPGRIRWLGLNAFAEDAEAGQADLRPDDIQALRRLALLCKTTPEYWRRIAEEWAKHHAPPAPKAKHGRKRATT